MSDDNWRWSRLRRDHDHILERKRNKGSGLIRGWWGGRQMGGRGAETVLQLLGHATHSMITAKGILPSVGT